MRANVGAPAFIIAIVLLGAQLMLAGFRGQAVALEGGDFAITDASARGCAVLLDDETSKRGLPHRHDGLPLHMHVEAEDALRNRVQPLDNDSIAMPPPAAVAEDLHRVFPRARDDGSSRRTRLLAAAADHRDATTLSLRAIRLRV